MRRPWFNRNTLLISLVTIGITAVAYSVVVVSRPASHPADNVVGGIASSEPSDPAGTSRGSMGSAGPSATASASAGPSATASAATATRPSAVAPAPPVQGGYPGPNNTGVPGGVTLTDYTGPCTITKANTVIDKKSVNCRLDINAKNVVIKRSRVNSQVDADDGATVRIEDSEVNGGRAQVAAVGFANVTILRSNIHGGHTSVACYANCLVQDSWLHGQYLASGADWHLNGLLSNGGSNVKLIHNTVSCDAQENSAGGGCTGNIAIFGDFSPVTDFTFDRNLFVANIEMPYCIYGGYDERSLKPHGPDAKRIIFTNNVFQRGTNKKCAYYGSNTSFNPRADGNVWSNNVWDDGTKLDPS